MFLSHHLQNQDDSDKNFVLIVLNIFAREYYNNKCFSPHLIMCLQWGNVLCFRCMCYFVSLFLVVSTSAIDSTQSQWKDIYKTIQKWTLMLVNTAQKDTRLFLVLIDNKKISEALRNGLRSNLLEVQATSVIDRRIRNAFLQLFTEFVCSLNTTATSRYHHEKQ